MKAPKGRTRSRPKAKASGDAPLPDHEGPIEQPSPVVEDIQDEWNGPMPSFLSVSAGCDTAPDTGKRRDRFLADVRAVQTRNRHDRQQRLRSPQSLELGTAQRRPVRQHQSSSRRRNPRPGVARRQAPIPALLARDTERPEESGSCSRSCWPRATRTRNIDAWPIRIGDGDQFGSGFVDVNPDSKIPALLDRSGREPIRVFDPVRSSSIWPKNSASSCPHRDRRAPRPFPRLFWQMGSAPFLGGGFGHFFAYAPEKFEYAINRYSMEAKRQFDVLNRRLERKRVCRR